jgi:hypothetical protein
VGFGYLSGHANYAAGNILAKTTGDAIWKAIDRHCELEPLNDIVEAALKVMHELQD